MTIFAFLALIIVCGVVCAYVNRFLPMHPAFQWLFNLVVALVVLWAILALLGVDTGIRPLRVR